MGSSELESVDSIYRVAQGRTARPMHDLMAPHTSQEVAMAKKRELVEPTKGDKRYVRRDEEGRFGEQDDVSKSLQRDQKREAKSVAKKGQGDKGDRKR
jgi:hypothetical protein